MPMQLLKVLAQQSLPYAVYAPVNIEKVRVLRAAGLITAFIPPPRQHTSGEAEVLRPAQVLAITEKGREALQRIPGP